MISVVEALDLVDQNIKQSEAGKVTLKESLGLILAEDVLSPIDMPPFNQSAMDGYAVNYDEKIKEYKVIGEVPAGSSQKFQLEAGEAVRIFTGAAVPLSATTVVRQEDVNVEGSTINFTAEIQQNKNIRPKGEQIKKSDIALTKGTEITPGGVGYLASLGLSEVAVHPRPTISILVTGNELVKPGAPLEYGKIYESNAVMLESALRQFGFFEVRQIAVPDNYEHTVTTIEEALKYTDLMIISGGISVGDYDYVGKALREIGVKEVFYKVKQKPGKPLFFGTFQDSSIFALPGNPASALTAFYLYILPTLSKLTGGKFVGCEQTELPITETYEKKGSRAEFLKAYATETEVDLLGAQSSAMLSSFAHANALVYIPEDVNIVEKGEFVLVLWL